MSGVDIAGLVEELAQQSDPHAIAKLICEALAERDRALLAQAAENASLLKERAEAVTEALEATRQRDEALAALKASEEALKEIARQKLPIELWAEFGSGHDADWEGGYDACVRRARSVLENCKARLADATNNPPSDPGTEQREAGV